MNAGGEYKRRKRLAAMLTIPLDGPSMEQRQAVMLTTYGLLRGLILHEDETEVRILINGSQRTIAREEIRTIATV
jgi:hypothetical protein